MAILSLESQKKGLSFKINNKHLLFPTEFIHH